MKKIDTLVIAVGGRGERLSDYFKTINFHNSKTLWPINGQPLLKCLIDMALRVGFKRIFLLTSFYEDEIQSFVNNFYKNKNILVVSGGNEGKKNGVIRVLFSISNQLTNPFIYSDGNILFEENLLKYLFKITHLNNILIKCVISPRDLVPTHSKFIINNDRISRIDLRYINSVKGNNEKLNGYCSLGLMVINNNIFNFIPNYKNISDLDVLVKELFCKNSNLIDYKIYKGDWFSIHTKEDIDKINNKYHSKLLRSLT